MSNNSNEEKPPLLELQIRPASSNKKIRINVSPQLTGRELLAIIAEKINYSDPKQIRAIYSGKEISEE
jgi:hypothetical protein